MHPNSVQRNWTRPLMRDSTSHLTGSRRTTSLSVSHLFLTRRKVARVPQTISPAANLSIEMFTVTAAIIATVTLVLQWSASLNTLRNSIITGDSSGVKLSAQHRRLMLDSDWIPLHQALIFVTASAALAFLVVPFVPRDPPLHLSTQLISWLGSLIGIYAVAQFVRGSVQDSRYMRKHIAEALCADLSESETLRLLKIEPCSSASRVRAFLHIPLDLGLTHPVRWLFRIREERALLSPKHSFALSGGRRELFIAYLDDHPVGRISAQIRRDKSRATGWASTGYFGFFECINSTHVAQLLVRSAWDWLRQHGADTMQGPFQWDINGISGIQVDDGGARSFPMCPDNPAYYADLLSDSGCSPLKELFAWRWWVGAVPEETRSKGELCRHPSISVRALDRNNLASEATAIIDLFNRAWKNNWGFIKLTSYDAVSFIHELRPVLDESICLIAELDDASSKTPVGIVFCVPNYYDIVDMQSRLGTGIELLTVMLKAFARVRHPIEPRSARMLLFGIDKPAGAPDALHWLAPRLFCAAMDALEFRGYKEVELSWTLANNARINNSIRRLRATRTRRFIIYECK